MFELALASDSSDSIMSAIKIYGQLMQGDNDEAIELFKTFPNLHLLILQNVIMAMDCTPAPVMTPRDTDELALKRDLVRQSLWAFSNIAAMYPAVSRLEAFEEDELLLKDGSVGQALEVVKAAQLHHQTELVIEGTFFLSALCTTVSTRQLATYLFHKEIVDVFIKVLDSKYGNAKLRLFVLDAL